MKIEGCCVVSSIVLMGAMSVGLTGAVRAAAAPPEAAQAGRGPIVNVAADGLVGCLVPPFRIDGTHTKTELIEAFQKQVDRYADAHVPYLFFNVCYQRTAYRSKAWDAYWDVDNPNANVTGWPRLYWLVHKKGVDPFQVCVVRCRQQGISPWMSIRMNDTHYQNDPTKTSSLWQNHPELRRVQDKQWYCGFDFAHKEVRDHFLALVQELLDRYDCAGIELDWMRFPQHFKPGEEQQGCRHLNGFMRRIRVLANEATVRRGHPVRIAARIPAVPEFARGLGMDGVAWARQGWVDILILSPEWRPSDTDIPIERWRVLLGPANEKVLLAAATDLWLQGAPGGKLMADDLETQRGFTAAMLDRGADLIYLFNHFNMSDFRRTERATGGQTVVRDESHALLSTAGRLAAALEGPRRHVVTFHAPAAPNMPNPTQLPAEITAERSATFRIGTGPKPSTGRVILRVGLDNLPEMGEARLDAQVNGVACKVIEDLARPGPRTPNPRDRLRVDHVADVAARMLQFEVPLEALVTVHGTNAISAGNSRSQAHFSVTTSSTKHVNTRRKMSQTPACERGQNRVDVLLNKGKPQKIIWLEIYIVPGRIP